MGPEEASKAIRSAHQLVWMDWLGGSLEQQRMDLLIYLERLPGTLQEVVSTWWNTKPFGEFAPPAATVWERNLFTNNILMLLSALPIQRSIPLQAGITETMKMSSLIASAVRLITERYTDCNLSLERLE